MAIDGWAFGAPLACRYPDHLSGLSTHWCLQRIEDLDERVKRQKWDGSQVDRIRELGVEGFYNEWQRLPIIATQQRIDLAIQTKMKANRLTQSIEGLANSMTHFGTGTMPDCWDALPNLTVPTLLMVEKRMPNIVVLPVR